MDNLKKLLLFLGQQYYLYHRQVIFIDELNQIFSGEQEIQEVLTEPLKEGWLQLVNDDKHLEITPLAITNWLQHWNKNIYQVGDVGGGSISVSPEDHRFTLTVEFDCPIKFVEHKTVNYENKAIELNLVDGFYYEAKVHVVEEEFPEAEEAINRYLSHLSYHYKIPVSIHATHSASSNISSSTRRHTPRTGIYLTIPDLQTLGQTQARATAFYRQFRNFSQIRTTESRYYQLMSLLKILEGVSPSANLTQNKIDFVSLVNRHLSNLSSELQAFARGVESRYLTIYGNNLSFSEIAWEHYRNGIAHWRARGNFLDPDVPDMSIATTINILEQISLLAMELDYKIPA